MSEQDKNKNLIFINSLCSCIDFSGENCTDFLNNLLISDLSTFKHGRFYYSALCNPKGRIISSLWININTSDYIQLICPINMQDLLLTFFKMRKFRLKIDISILNTNIYFNNDGVFLSDESIEYQSSNIHSNFYKKLFNLNLPWINEKNSEKFIPQHVNLDKQELTMSFTKGCYPGQEIIARMKFLGKIKKRMNVIESDSKTFLMTKLDARNQVSPIIQSHNRFSVQIIEQISNTKD